MKAHPDPAAADTSHKKIMILAGEPSGDVHGGHLAAEIRSADPKASLFGIGGPNMAGQGVDLIFPIEKLSAMGLVEILGQFKQIRQAFQIFKETVRRRNPDLVILIDYPGFNLRAAAWLKANTNAKVLYYITPKVWAWNQKRLNKIKAHVDHAALIFPFEIPIYRRYGIPATFVGNPLMDQLPALTFNPATGRNKPLTLGILPGSRRAEIQTLLPVLLQSATDLSQDYPKMQILLSAAQSVQGELMEFVRDTLATYDPEGKITLVEGQPEPIFQQANLLFAASGTVTLEAALRSIPTILVYKMSPVTYALARLLVKVEHAGLANLVAGKEVMPELLQDDAEPEQICSLARKMLESPDTYRRRLDLVRRRLGPPGASKRAARIALNLAARTPNKGI